MKMSDDSSGWTTAGMSCKQLPTVKCVEAEK